MHNLDASTTDAIPYYAGVVLRMGKKTGKAGIGQKKRWNGALVPESSKKSPSKPLNRPFKRARLRQVSPKQAKRTAELKKKLKRMTLVQELYGYNAHCQKCLKAKTDGNYLKLYADHIGTRNQKDADRFENLGILCGKCNFLKGSVREDYRPTWFKAEMKSLDANSSLLL